MIKTKRLIEIKEIQIFNRYIILYIKFKYIL